MAKAGAGFGLICPNCKCRIDVHGTAGSDPELCPQCGHKMVANPSAKITAGVSCKKCHSSFGIINSDKCPNCGEAFS